MKNSRVAGCDPGLVNFGFSIVDYKKSKIKVLHSHMVQNRVTDFKVNVLGQRLLFYKEIKRYLIKYKPGKLVVERFMSRGRFGQSIGECISFMLGTLADLCHRLHIELVLVTSASWKNAFQRALKKKLDSLYKFLKPLPPHIIDSILQATYGIDKTYQYWNIEHLKEVRDKWQK